jgi:homoserine O-succinyltransferase
MNWFGPRSTGGPPLTLDRPPVIALVNNTSDRALRATEGQFLRVLRVTSDEPGPCVRFFTCPEIPRATPPRTALGHPYEDIGGIFDSEIDALIVTGMEPQAANLQEEPVWSSLTKLIDWASVRRLPVIWSCLAAHAAVLHLDGIARIRQGRKLSGIFECDIASAGHPLMAGLPQQWRNPHSRYYDVPEAALVAKGYQVLSRSAKAGVNIFARHLGAPFLFFQGHPEYDPDTLLREYRRDVRRYVLREREEYPFAPEGCLAARTEARLSSLRD